MLLITFTFFLCCWVSSSCAISMCSLPAPLMLLVICDVNFSSPFSFLRWTAELPNQMFNKTARCLLFYIPEYTRCFFLLSYVPHMKVNLMSCTGFTGHREVGDWSDCKFSPVQYLVFLYRAPGRHWSVEAYHAPRGNSGAWALEETLFRVCEFTKLHNCCAITRICAGGLTACFLSSVCFLPVLLGDSVVFPAIQQARWCGWAQPFTGQLLCGVFGCVFSTNPPHWLLHSSQPASRPNTMPSGAPRWSETQLLNQLCSVATLPLTFVL